MEPAFWLGFFGLGTAIVTAIAAHLKNVQQDKQALRRDCRILLLEAEHRKCEVERVELLKQLTQMKVKPV